MALFSKRKGYVPLNKTIQIEDMDDDLRASLWNALTICYWDYMKDNCVSSNREIANICSRLWQDYFKKPIDVMDNEWNKTYKVIRVYFFKCVWYEVYDFIEFMGGNFDDSNPYIYNNKKFIIYVNNCLERESSAYRFVGKQITQITSESEIAEIEMALENTDKLKPINIHLSTSLKYLSDRKNPDYRNSIKESISAVESLCVLISGNSKASFDQAMKIIETKITLHGALKNAFKNLYGYTSDSDGIRHALLNEPKLEFEDAKFMLVSCSAFINYLIAKAAKASINLT